MKGSYRLVWLELHPDYYRTWRKKPPNYFKNYGKMWQKANPDYYKEYRKKDLFQLRSHWREYKRKRKKRLTIFENKAIFRLISTQHCIEQIITAACIFQHFIAVHKKNHS